MVSIQSSYTSPSKSSRNLVSCSLLTSYFCSFIYLSCGDVICGTSYLYSLSYPSCANVIYGTSCLYSFNCPSCGDVICGTFVPLLALQMVPLCPSSFFVFLLPCSLVCSSLVNLRLLLPQLYYSSWEHFSVNLLQPSFYFLVLFTSLP